MTKFAFFQGAIRPIDQAKVSIMTHTFNYGTGCFGGIRGYWSEQQEQLYLFRLHDHYRRFLNSGKLLLARLDYSPEQLAEITIQLMAHEAWRTDCYVRPLIYKADETIGVRLHNLHDEVAIFSVAMGRYIDAEEGAKVCTSSWRRVDDTAIPPRGKLIGSYMNSALAKSEAYLNGFDEAIVLNQDGHVAEGSAANIVIIRDDRLVTPPFSSNNLEGITLRTIQHLAEEELKLQVVQRQIDRSELYVADEAFFCGTGAQIVAISSIDHRPVGDGNIGPWTRRLRNLYFQVVRGEISRYHHWLTPVPKAILA